MSEFHPPPPPPPPPAPEYQLVLFIVAPIYLYFAFEWSFSVIIFQNPTSPRLPFRTSPQGPPIIYSHPSALGCDTFKSYSFRRGVSDYPLPCLLGETCCRTHLVRPLILTCSSEVSPFSERLPLARSLLFSCFFPRPRPRLRTGPGYLVERQLPGEVGFKSPFLEISFARGRPGLSSLTGHLPLSSSPFMSFEGCFHTLRCFL